MRLEERSDDGPPALPKSRSTGRRTTMVRTMTACVGGMKPTVVGVNSLVAGGSAGANPLERLIRIMRENDQLLGRLEAVGRRLGQARAYADDPGSNPSLSTTLVEHARAGYAKVLDKLRSNRVEALGILRSCGHRDAG
jgi:hypothetical protein